LYDILYRVRLGANLIGRLQRRDGFRPAAPKSCSKEMNLALVFAGAGWISGGGRNWAETITASAVMRIGLTRGVFLYSKRGAGRKRATAAPDPQPQTLEPPCPFNI
jgi:hypothetical protein